MSVSQSQIQDLDRQGFLVVPNVLSQDELKWYGMLYEDFISGKLDASNHRHDLGSHATQPPLSSSSSKAGKVENITQIMWPSLYLGKPLEESPLHQKAQSMAKALLGADMAFDFDMLISKEPFSDVETPWHSDESYWLDLPDKRALSFWFPMQDVKVENGCMWFVPGSHKMPLRPHRPTKPGHHVLMTDECSNDEGLPQPLEAGGCTIHTGRTLHYTAGNKTAKARRAYIVNFRPQTMIDLEREKNYDHGKAGLEQGKLKGQIHSNQNN